MRRWAETQRTKPRTLNPEQGSERGKKNGKKKNKEKGRKEKAQTYGYVALRVRPNCIQITNTNKPLSTFEYLSMWSN